MVEQHKIKQVPMQLWGIGAFENWLYDMSSKGWHIIQYASNGVHFKKGEPQKIDYRIELSEENSLFVEQEEMYEEAGWRYLTGYEHIHIFKAIEGVERVEIYSDPAEQAATFNGFLAKMATSPIKLGLILTIVLLFMLQEVGIKSIFFNVVTRSTTFFLYIAFILMISWLFKYRNYRNLCKQVEHLKSGIPINHRKKYRPNYLKWIVLTVVIAGFVMLVGTKSKWVFHETARAIEQVDIEGNQPYLLLSDLDFTDVLKDYQQITYNDGYYPSLPNTVKERASLWTKNQYVVSQQVELKELTTNIPTEKFLYTEHFELRGEWYLQAFVKSLMKGRDVRLVDKYEPETVLLKQVNDARFDQLYISNERNFISIIAVHDLTVIYLHYKSPEVYSEKDEIVTMVSQKVVNHK